MKKKWFTAGARTQGSAFSSTTFASETKLHQKWNKMQKCVILTQLFNSDVALILGLSHLGRNEAEGGFSALGTALQRSPQVSTSRLAKSNIQEHLLLSIRQEQRQRFLSWPGRDETSTVNCPSWKTTCAVFPVTKTSEMKNYAEIQFIWIYLAIKKRKKNLAQKHVEF